MLLWWFIYYSLSPFFPFSYTSFEINSKEKESYARLDQIKVMSNDEVNSLH